MVEMGSSRRQVMAKVDSMAKASRSRTAGLALGLLLAAAAAAAQEPEPRLGPECIATVLNRTVQVSADGGFAIGNVPNPVGAFRVRVVCETADGVLRAQSAFVEGIANGVTPLGDITFGVDDPIPVDLEITSPVLVLTPTVNGSQLNTTGTLPDGLRIDLTLADSGTFYLSSNPAIASVSEDGFVLANSSGRVLITATHEGVIATLALDVELAVDSDGDGLPDDFEALNAVNPGGSNLARLGGVQVLVSSASPSFPEGRAIDGNRQTSWFTAVGDAANQRTTPFIEVLLPADQRVAQVRLVGNRQNPDGFDIFAGVFQIFDAAGTELLNSGEVALPAPSRDIAVPVDLDGVRRVRFTSTDDESNTPGLAEIEVIARPGGAGLNANNPGDGDADFDQDGLSNREEFELGSSIFLNDTDGDGLLDAAEVALGTSPVLADSDFDGLIDGQESNPTADFDRDGLVNALDADADNDGLPDGVEVRLGLNPLRVDSNFNGIPDGSEDSDGDGLINGDEVLESTDAGNPDSDGDGLLDGEEVLAGDDGFFTDPLRPDSDGDGMFDGFESIFGLDPTDPGDAGGDPDLDGLTNLEEFERGTDPRNPDRVPPQVAEITPVDGSSGHPVNGVIVVRFTEALKADSVAAGVVRLFAGTAEVAGAVAASVDGLSVTFNPAEQLASEAPHSVRVAGVRDRAGNLLESPFESAFTTGVFVDTVRPFAVRTSPLNGQVAVPVNVPFEIEFSERLDPATLTTTNFRIRDEVTFLNVAGMIQVDADGRTASFVPEMPFAIGRRHRVILSTNILDAAGNRLTGSTQFIFTADFVPDNGRPVLVGTSPIDGDSAVPVNALVMLDFSEPLSLISVLRGIRVETAAGEPVAGSFALSSGNTRVTFTSMEALAATTVHRVVVTTQLTDAVGNPLDNPGSRSFVTGAAGDVTRPTIVSFDPLNNTFDVPLSIAATVQLSERINALTVPGNFFIETDFSPVVRVPGTVAVAADRLSATFTPSAPLSANTRYRIRTFNGMHDLTGRTLNSTSLPSRFTTGFAADAEPPRVIEVSPVDGALAVPTNARVVVRLSETVTPLSVGASALTLTTSAGLVSGSTSLSSDRRTLTFSPAEPLAVSTLHTVAVAALRDRSGNALVPFTSGFTTSSSAAADTRRPRVSTVFPAHGSGGVDVGTAIVVTFDEVVDPTTVSTVSMPMTISGFSGVVAGGYAVDGAVVTFTPQTPLPTGRRINVRVNSGSTTAVRDFAGNLSNFFSSFFDTGSAGADVTPPQVLLVSPVDAADEVGRSGRAVLTFSESLNAATVSGNNFALFANGQRLSTSVGRSSDNRTVTLTPSSTLPASSVVTVVATDGVQDLSGNRLVDFASTFTTVGGTDSSRPSVVNQRPGNGASGVPLDRAVVVYVNEDLDLATVPGAFFVTENGQQVAGTTEVTGGGRAIRFVPDQPWRPGALVQVFVSTSARDTSGNSLNNYSGSFRTRTDTSGTRASLVRSVPGSSVTGVVLNPVIELEFNEPLDPATVNGSTVLLRRNISGLPSVPATVSLVRGGGVIRIDPQVELEPSSLYRYDVTTGVLDLDGATIFNFARFFTTGSAADTTAPQVRVLSPRDGAANVALNSHVRVRFSEPVSPISVNETTVAIGNESGDLVSCSISFTNGNRDILMVPNAPLAPEEVHMLLVSGVEDTAGNPVSDAESIFTTGPAPDTAAPVLVRRTPFANAVDVAVNAVVTVELSEPIDPVTLTTSSFRLRDEVTFQNVPGTVSLSGGDRILSFVPSAPLAVGRRHRIIIGHGGVTDLANNRITGGDAFFTTAFVDDTDRPQIAGVSPEDGALAVPTNGRVEVRFDEPIQEFSSAGVTLSAAGAEVAVLRSLSDANRRLILTPLLPLQPTTEHTLTVTGVRDLSGNELAAPLVTRFTTETGVDLIRPTITLLDPVNGATGVATNPVARIAFSERMNRLTVTTAAFFLETDFSPVVRVPGTVTVAADGRSAAFVPAAPLTPEVRYRIRTLSSMQDLTGQSLSFTSLPVRFTTGPGVDTAGPVVTSVSPPEGTLDVPVNSRAVVRFGEALSRVDLGAGSFTVSAAGAPAAGSLSLSSDRRTVTFVPASALATSTLYDIAVSGFTDRSGNPAPLFISSFTTSSSSADDTTRPRVFSVSPTHGSVAVDPTTAVVVTFDEGIDPATVSTVSMPITISGFSGVVAGGYAVDGAVVTFTPLNPLPADRRINVRVNSGSTTAVHDFAGNLSNFFSSFFDTGDTVVDTMPPEVVLVSPAAGAAEVSQGSRVVLTFSESLNAATVSSSNFALLADGATRSASISRSSDNRTVVLVPSSTLPGGSVVTVVATDGVRDLSGNPLADFASAFTTVTAAETGRPSVVNQRPGNGASGVPLDRNVVLYVNEDLDPATIPGAFFLTQNGVEVSGTEAVMGDGRTIEFFPGTPWQPGALVQIFLQTSARDVQGNALNNYSGSFRTRTDTSGTRASLVRSVPGSSVTGVVLNPVIELEFNEPLDPATVNGSTVLLRRNISGLPSVPATVSLVRGGRVIRIDPQVELEPSSLYRYDVTTGVLDLDGDIVFNFARFFTTGTASDLVAPQVTSTSPRDGAALVATNAHVRLRFSEPVSPISVNEETVAIGNDSGNLVSCSISFSNGNRDVLMVPNSPLAPSAIHLVMVEGVEDSAGNLVTPLTVTFTSGPDPDTAAPVLTRRTPLANAVGVPVNAVVSVELSEPIDPVTLTTSSFRVRDETTFQNVPGTVSLAGGDRVVSFVPAAPYVTDRRFRIILGHAGITDLSNNRITSGDSFFTTAATADTVAPQVRGVSPEDSLLGAPINSRVEIRFDEPIQALTTDGVTLSLAGGPVAVSKSQADANRRLILTPGEPLLPETAYTVTVVGVLDQAGNALETAQVTTFTTEPGADLIRPTITLVDPINSSTVGTNVVPRIAFSERMNKLTLTTADFFVETDVSPITRVPGTVTVAADGRSAVFTPDAPLSPSTRYRIRTFSNMLDLTGRTLSSTSLPVRFTTGAAEDLTAPAIAAGSPPDGETEVPVNGRVSLRFAEPVAVVSVVDGGLALSSPSGPLDGSFGFSSDRRTVTFTPSSALAVSTTYTLDIDGVLDRSANPVSPVATSFTTAASAAVDSSRPTLSTVDPPHGASGISATAPIVMTFGERVDPSSVTSVSMPMTISGVSGTVAGTYTVAGAVVTFTPDAPWPAGARINTRVNSGSTTAVRDYAGNLSNFFSSLFTITP